ncbi:hypothetical protein [Burkholderia sp. Ed8]|uniref:hypothetical protein n=1 Tax=Burkholderia sp. Ed8 TaxID=3112957 RepID=UPI000AB0EF35
MRRMAAASGTPARPLASTAGARAAIAAARQPIRLVGARERVHMLQCVDRRSGTN